MIGKKKIHYFAWRNAFEGAQNWMRNEPGWKKNSPGTGLRGWGLKVPAAHNTKTIHGIKMKFGRVVDNHKLINSV